MNFYNLEAEKKYFEEFDNYKKYSDISKYAPLRKKYDFEGYFSCLSFLGLPNVTEDFYANLAIKRLNNYNTGLILLQLSDIYVEDAKKSGFLHIDLSHITRIPPDIHMLLEMNLSQVFPDLKEKSELFKIKKLSINIKKGELFRIDPALFNNKKVEVTYLNIDKKVDISNFDMEYDKNLYKVLVDNASNYNHNQKLSDKILRNKKTVTNKVISYSDINKINNSLNMVVENKERNNTVSKQVINKFNDSLNKLHSSVNNHKDNNLLFCFDDINNPLKNQDFINENKKIVNDKLLSIRSNKNLDISSKSLSGSNSNSSNDSNGSEDSSSDNDCTLIPVKANPNDPVFLRVTCHLINSHLGWENNKEFYWLTEKYAQQNINNYFPIKNNEYTLKNLSMNVTARLKGYLKIYPKYLADLKKGMPKDRIKNLNKYIVSFCEHNAALQLADKSKFEIDGDTVKIELRNLCYITKYVTNYLKTQCKGKNIELVLSNCDLYNVDKGLFSLTGGFLKKSSVKSLRLSGDFRTNNLPSSLRKKLKELKTKYSSYSNKLKI